MKYSIFKLIFSENGCHIGKIWGFLCDLCLIFMHCDRVVQGKLSPSLCEYITLETSQHHSGELCKQNIGSVGKH
ncbi:MAG: hypothetical protein IGS23_09870 [Rivularia sp. T60_A2020_040]|nr:hypothetical protein [Rivularia sp. T60_A2020_040]